MSLIIVVVGHKFRIVFTEPFHMRMEARAYHFPFSFVNAPIPNAQHIEVEEPCSFWALAEEGEWT